MKINDMQILYLVHLHGQQNDGKYKKTVHYNKQTMQEIHIYKILRPAGRTDR